MHADDSLFNRLADFIHEAGMLRHTQRTGWPFLGVNSENVAEHSFRTAVIGYILAKQAQANVLEVVLECLFHDLHEARTGDFNYVYHRYNTTKARQALKDGLAGTGLSEDILGLTDRFERAETVESRLARDADQLDFIANLVVARANGSSFANDWLESALLRLTTEAGRELAKSLVTVDPNAWWYARVPKSWWVHHRDCADDTQN